MKTRLVCLLLATNTMVWLGQAQITETNSIQAAQTTATLLQTWDTISNRWISIPSAKIKLAAEQGDPSAQYYLGRTYFQGSGSTLDQAAALKWIKNAAEGGLAEAQNYLGRMYLAGNGVEQNDNQAVEWYRKAAEQGYALAEANLGLMYGHGRGVEQNYELAEKWMHQAAEQGSAQLQCAYAELLIHEFDKEGHQIANFQVASEWMRKAAEQDYAKAQYELAELYNYGKLGDDQRSNCIPWYLKAAANGSVEAQAEIGELPRYYPNNPLLKSVNTVDALRQSAEKGNLDAQFQLAKRYQTGDGVPQDPSEAFKWMQKAAEHDGSKSSVVSDARCQLGLMYEKGEGIMPDLTKAHDLFLSAVQDCMYAGNSAMFSLGQMYEKGIGVAQNDHLAAEFYAGKTRNYNYPDKYPNGFIEYLGSGTEAIENLLHLWAQGRGFPDDRDKAVPGYRKPEDLIASRAGSITTAKAQYYVGEIYYQGKLVPKDVAKAADWFNKAATQGSPEAMNRIGEMWAAGMNGAPDPKEAAKWYHKAAAKGLAEAQYNLGLCYAKGDSVLVNPVEAWEWLQLAAEQKFPNAAEERDKMQATMTADQVNNARTMADQIKTAGKNEPKP
jgi:hypothetical protein